MPKLIFPQEIEVWYILPLIRRKIALKLIESGLAQNKVAEMMGITPAAVNQYKKRKRAKEDVFDEELETELLNSIRKIISNHGLLGKEIIRLNNLVKRRGLICKLYQNRCILGKDKESCPYCKQ